MTYDEADKYFQKCLKVVLEECPNTYISDSI